MTDELLSLTFSQMVANWQREFRQKVDPSLVARELVVLLAEGYLQLDPVATVERNEICVCITDRGRNLEITFTRSIQQRPRQN